MRTGICLIVIAACLASGCSHYFNSPYGGRNQAHSIACDGDPPNQPGCYDRNEKRLDQIYQDVMDSR